MGVPEFRLPPHRAQLLFRMGKRCRVQMVDSDDGDSSTDRPRPLGRTDSTVAADRGTDVEPGTWYWDRRAERPLYARRADDEAIEFVSVWLPEEAADALATGAVVQLDEMDFDRDGGPFALKDSYRTTLETEDPEGAES